MVIPEDQPPGLYWYRPQVHGIHDGAQQGGATGALIVEGIQNMQPAVAGLPAQTFVVRAQPVPFAPFPAIGSEVPSWDLSVNYVTISSCEDYPQPCTQFLGVFKPAVLQMKPGEKQLWRVVNSTPHIPLDLELLYDGALQTLQLVAVDGVPVNAHDGAAGGRTMAQTELIVPPGGTAEFIIRGPSASVQKAVFKTLRFPTGPTGDNHPERPLFAIRTNPDAEAVVVRIPRVLPLWPTPSPPRPAISIFPRFCRIPITRSVPRTFTSPRVHVSVGPALALPRFSAPTIPLLSSPRRGQPRIGPSRTVPWKTTRSISTIFISWSWRLTAYPCRKTSSQFRMWSFFPSGTV